MSTEVVMPQMGESIFEGTITRWLKKVGEQVQKDEPLFEISTDKVDAEIPAPVAGTLSEIRIEAGATVTVNTVVAIIGGELSASAPKPAAPAAEAPKPTPIAAPKPAAAPAPTHVAHTPTVLHASSDEAPRSSPLVRRIATENNIDLRNVAGTGLGNRVSKEDILAYIANPASAKHTSRHSAPAHKKTEPLAPISTLPGTIAPMSKMRAIIAQRMVESMATSPHVHTVFKIDMTRVVHARSRARLYCEEKYALRLSYMPFIAAAVIDALRRFPVVNSSLVGNDIHYHANVNLGIAVALDWGLIVPVVRASETLDFISLARSIADLADRARTKKLKPDEASGSSFTLTNSGIFGDEFGTPIINQPESAILAIGALKKEPVVVTDADGHDAIAIRSIQHFCLGFDHRIIDGADSGKFMSQFKQNLETWDTPIV